MLLALLAVLAHARAAPPSPCTLAALKSGNLTALKGGRRLRQWGEAAACIGEAIG
jgi:hypothetical protein